MVPGSSSSEETVEIIREQFSLAWSSFKNIFTTQVFKGLLGKLTAAISAVWRIIMNLFSDQDPGNKTRYRFVAKVTYSNTSKV